MELTPHPLHPPTAISGISVTAKRNGHVLRLRYEVSGEASGLRFAAGEGRTDELWRHSCFEAFLTGLDMGYREFNFAPSGAWAAYAFDGYRSGMRDADAAPVTGWNGHAMLAEVAVDCAGDWRLNLTAVMEEADGTKSYWALAHPDGPPDFHDPDCFVLTLPAAG